MSSAAVPATAPVGQRGYSGAGLWIAPPLLILAGSFFYPLTLVLGEAVLSDARALTLRALRRGVPIRPLSERLLHTVEIALAASAGCLVLGFDSRADPDLRAVSRRPACWRG